MKLRDPLDELRELGRNPTTTENGVGAGGNLANVRGTGEALLAAGDEAIERALSGNSEAFVTASRQSGGE